MAYHARLGPSGAYIWMRCTASPNESDGKPNEGNDASRMGTACHGVASECLLNDQEPQEYLDQAFVFAKDNTGSRHENFQPLLPAVSDLTVEYQLPITQEYIEHVNVYVNFVRDLHAAIGGELHVEQRVPIDHITGEKDAGGTSDTIIIAGDTAIAIDAKFGRNKVEAYETIQPALPHPITGEIQPPVLEPNSQLAMYASGALRKHDPFGMVQTVKLIIVQPPLKHVSEYTLSVAELDSFIARVRQKAEETRTAPVFNPGDHCTYCKGSVTCVARDKHVLETSLEGFTDVSDPLQVAHARPRAVDTNMLGVMLAKIDMIQGWCADIQKRAFEELLAGRPVIREDGMRYKLVEGRAGHRKWTDDKIAEDALSKMRLKREQIYDMSLISPATAEKLATPKKNRKGEIVVEAPLGARQWKKLEELITQSDGKPTIALETDPRPALPSAVNGFEEVSQPATEEVDLFN